MCAITEIQDVRVYTGLFVKLCVKNDVCKILKKNHFFLDQPKIDFAPGWSQVLGLVVLLYCNSTGSFCKLCMYSPVYTV